MAIEFQSTSISGASAAAAGTTAQSAARDALVNHASGAWTLVEEFDSAGATVHWVVVKCNHLISGATADFYVCIGRVASTGQIGILVGEVYTAATHTLGTFAPNAQTLSSNTILADGSYATSSGGSTAQFVLGTSLPNATQLPFCPLDVAAATLRFVKVVDADHAIIVLNTMVYYIGALTDLLVPDANIPAATPIALCDFLNSSQCFFGYLTRHPIDAANAPLTTSMVFALMQASNFMTMIQRQAIDTAMYGYPDRYQGNRVAASEIAAIMFASSYNNNALNTAAKVGALRGKFKHMRYATMPAAAVQYDTISVDGRKHLILQDKGTPSSSEFVVPNGLSATTKLGLVVDTGVAG